MSYQIVVGVDGSDNAAQALRWAFDEAGSHGGEVTAVFAWRFPLIGIPGAFDRDELETAAKQLLTSAVEAAEPPAGMNVNSVVAQGDPSESLVKACDTLDADLLVVGTHRRGGLPGELLDAVAAASCPVVIVKPLPNGASAAS